MAYKIKTKKRTKKEQEALEFVAKRLGGKVVPYKSEKPKKAKKKFHGAIVENTTWLGKKQIKFEGMKSV